MITEGSFILLCFAMFKLGAYVERNPGRLWPSIKGPGACVLGTMRRAIQFSLMALWQPRTLRMAVNVCLAIDWALHLVPRVLLKGGKMRFMMSIGSLLVLAACYGMFKLGAYHERHPGQIVEMGKQVWQWMQQ